jgi:tetratricopeptide (TPR) repeat protein
MLLKYIRKNARLLSGVFFSLLLTACAGTPQTQKLSQLPPADIPRTVELNGVAFFPQEKYQCGPAALATVLSAQGVQIRAEDLVDKVYLPEREGSLQIEMVATARSYKQLTYPLSGELDAILKEVASGRPVLIFQNLSLPWVPQWHYAVVVGYDLAQQTITLRSGTTKRRITSLSTFERTWQRGDYWAYVLAKPGDIPVTANVLEYSRSASALMQAGHKQSALIALDAASKRWPEESLPQMMLGNAFYADQAYIQAVAAFNQAVAIEPENAQAWNNLAYALSASQCQTAAIKAIGCAVRLAPDDKNLADSLKELVEQKDIPAGMCTVPRCPRFQ